MPIARPAASAQRTVVVAHPSAELYGSDRTLLESVGALAAGGWRVVTVLPAAGPLVEHMERLGAQVLFQTSPVLRKNNLSPAGLVRLLLSLRTLPALVRLLRRLSPDVVYVNTITLPLWLLAARLVRIPVLCHVHEAEADLPRVAQWGLTAPLTLATRLVVNSRASTQALLSSRASLARRARIIYNGVPGPERASAPRPAVTGRVNLLLVGRLSPRKGTDVAVAAVDELCLQGYDVALELVGDTFPGYEWFEDSVRRQAEAPRMAGRVTFSGFTEDVWAAFEQSDIVLVPSRTEPFGNVAVEGMLAWRPVVAAAVQGLTEIVQDGSTGLLVRPDDPSALGAAIRELCDDWPRALRIADAGRIRAEAAFSTARYARELVEAVSDTAAAGR